MRALILCCLLLVLTNQALWAQKLSVQDRACITRAVAKLPKVTDLEIEESRIVPQQQVQGRHDPDLYHVKVEIDVNVAGHSSTYIFNCIRTGELTVIQPLGMRQTQPSGIRQTQPPPSQRTGGVAVNYSFNIHTFGATCDGTDDDGPALAAAGAKFRSIQTVTPGADVILVIPSGARCVLKTCPNASDGQHAFANVTNITIIATGATITATNTGNCGAFTGSIMNPWTADAFNPNNIGDTCVTMTTPGTEANYPVGRWVILGGQGLQVNSFPPNYANFEYLQVTSNTRGQLCFASPLQNFYPNDARAGVDLTVQNCSNNYCGGPGKVSLMSLAWGGYFRTIGGTWDTTQSNGGSTWWPMHQVVFDNVTWNGGSPLGSNQCWFPTFVGTVTYNNSSFANCNVEVDKEIDQIIVNNSSFRSLQFQSQSVHSITLNNGSNTSLVGTPLHTSCNNSTIGLAIGNTYGSSPETFVGVNCAFSIGNQAFNGFGLDGVTVTYASGTFSIPNSDVCGGLPQWNATGGRMAMSGAGATDADDYFTITGSFVDITNPSDPSYCNQTLFITTTLPNATAPPFAGGAIGWAVDQARDMSCSGCTGINGDRIPQDLNFTAAQHQPLYTYLNRTFTCPNNMANVPGSFDLTGDPHNGNTFDSWAVRGNWVSLSVNVITADTNPSDTTPQLFFGPGQLFNPSTGAQAFNVSNTVNLAIAGTRTMSSTAVTGSQSGDSFTLPAYGTNTWVDGGGGRAASSGWTNGPAAQCPVVNVIFQTSR